MKRKLIFYRANNTKAGVVPKTSERLGDTWNFFVTSQQVRLIGGK